LDGRIALVTGAGSGIGRAIAVDFARAGAQVVICGRRREPLEETAALMGDAVVETADVADPASIEKLANAVLAALGGVDILVNNAGFSSQVRSARHIGPEEWRAVMDVNTLGPAMLTRLLLPSLVERSRGDVVTVSSMAALRPSIMAGAAYSAAKAAVRAYMEVLYNEVRKEGVRCTTVFRGRSTLRSSTTGRCRRMRINERS